MNRLQLLTKHYLSMTPIHSVKVKDYVDEWPAVTVDDQGAILAATLHHPASRRRPPSLRYRTAFTKALITQLEAAGVVVGDALYDELGDLMGRASAAEGNLCYKTYTLPDGELLSIKESQQLISKGTTGLQTWQAAQLLAEWALENTSCLSGQRVLELGSGLGLTGLVVHAACHPAQYVFSDCHPDVLSLLTENVDDNLAATPAPPTLTPSHPTGQTGTAHYWTPPPSAWTQLRSVDDVAARWQHRGVPAVQVAALDWERLSAGDVTGVCGDVDVVLAADVVYDASIVPALVAMLRALLGQQHRPKAYIASTVRNEATRDYFIQELGLRGVKHQELSGPRQEVFFYDKTTPIQLLELCVPLSDNEPR